MNFASKTLVFLGILLLLFGSYLTFQRYDPKKLGFKNFNAGSGKLSADFPRQVIIRELNIYLPIYPAQVNNGSWQTTTEGVSYLSSSPLPGNRGNSIIYGHNWENLLGPLTKIKPGQKIEIVYSDNTNKTFVVEYTQVVTSDQTHILNPTKDRRITIYTCTGFLDLKRFIAVAILKES